MESVVSYLKHIRENYIGEFMSLETRGAFERTSWSYHKGNGGGEFAILRGSVFEKASVNWSGIYGDEFPKTAAGETSKGPFFATGVSLITHMRNPKAPTVHFNLRYIETPDKIWIGGGYDLTPMGFPFDDDTTHFHSIAKKSLDPFGDTLYSTFSQQAVDYFTIPHYKCERGVGGIFFDHFRSGNLINDLKMFESIGDHFLDAIMPIYKRRIDEDYTTEDRERQLTYRARYVEFNLIYDRGTKFGFKSGANPEAILCSLPPLAAW